MRLAHPEIRVGQVGATQPSSMLVEGRLTQNSHEPGSPEFVTNDASVRAPQIRRANAGKERVTSVPLRDRVTVTALP